MNRVFISYSRKDTEQMGQIRKDLEANLFHIWVDQKRIMPGDTLSEEIRNAIINAACVLVLVSSSSVESSWVKQEIALALEHKIRIIPLLLDGTLAHIRSLKLDHLVFIDFSRNFDYALKDLTNALRKITDPRPEREWTDAYVFDTQTDTFSLGNLTSDWYIVDGNGIDSYLPQNIHTHYIDTPLELPAELAARRDHIGERENNRAKMGLQSAWNGGLYYLQSVNVGRHGTEEAPIIDMWFGPTDYFTFLATNALLLDQEDPDTAALIERYFVDADWNTPIRYFSNSFGINLAVITSDQKIILAQRSNNVASRPGALGVSINEGLSRPIDQPNPDLGPDFYVCGMRGAHEELGISVDRDAITYLSIGVDKAYSQWGILGCCKSEMSADAILNARARGVKDKWEYSKLIAIPLDLDVILRYILKGGGTGLHGAALTCLYHTLVHIYGRDQVNSVLKNI